MALRHNVMAAEEEAPHKKIRSAASALNDAEITVGEVRTNLGAVIP